MKGTRVTVPSDAELSVEHEFDGKAGPYTAPLFGSSLAVSTLQPIKVQIGRGWSVTALQRGARAGAAVPVEGGGEAHTARRALGRVTRWAAEGRQQQHHVQQQHQHQQL